MKLIAKIVAAFAALLSLGACMEYGPLESSEFDTAGDGVGLFITNEGNFMYGNASLSYYNPQTKKVENEVFVRANGMLLGDVAQSMTLHNGIGWVVVNNSGVIFAVNAATFKEVGRITGFTSPRYIHFVSDEKAYVTQLWDARICIINPRTFRITGYIETDMSPQTASTEQLVQYGDYLFVTCWSYQNRILVIDTRTDRVSDQITVGIQPAAIVLDKNDKLWVLTDGGYEGNPYGHEPAALFRIDAATRQIERQYTFGASDSPTALQLNGARDTLYYINKSLYRMPVTAEELPAEAFVAARQSTYYHLTVDPVRSEVYLADAIDYMQAGVVYRYSARGELLDTFRVGITPGGFCWRP